MDGGEDLLIPADPALPEQVLWSPFLNAAEAMNSGEEIRVSLKDTPKAVVMTITDPGAGIPAEMLRRMFRRFVTTKPSGTGLGLPPCRNIVEAYGVTIEIASEVGRGTTVTLGLPRA